ncbi:uncharacterized protein METZ01_LOCUS408716, partial [marine metagenome]
VEQEPVAEFYLLLFCEWWFFKS